MNARTNYPKFTSLFTAFTASLFLLSCGSFQGASYFSSDGIYTTEVQTRTEQPVAEQKNSSNYYSNYFKDAAQGTTAENEMYFTDTENYTSEETFVDENTYVESSQIPWGEKTTQREIIIVDRSPNYFWGLSGFAFRASPFWNNYYFNDPFRFGYGLYGAPFVNPYVNPYFGGYAGHWGYDPFFSPFNYFSGNRYGYGWNRWNRWNRWNQWGGYGAGQYGYNGSNGYGKDYNSTIARVKSGRGEKNYESSRRSNATQDRNTKNNKENKAVQPMNRINTGRGLNSLGTTYLLSNRGNTTLGAKDIGKSKTARPTFGSTSGGSGLSSTNRTNTNPSKSVQGNSRGRFTQSRYRSLGERQSPKTTSPRNNINRTSTPNRGTSTTISNNSNFRRSNSVNKSVNKSYNPNTARARSYSTPSYRSTAPSRSYNSSGSSRSSSSGGRSSSRGRRN